MKKYLLIFFSLFLLCCMAFSFVDSQKEEDVFTLLSIADYRITKFSMNVSKRDMDLLQKTFPFVVDVCNIFSVNPLFLLVLIEHESNYKWVFGDSGQAVGFLQLHLNTAKFIQKKYSNLIEKLGLFCSEITSIEELNKTPVKTMVLSTLWFCYNFQKTNGSYIKAIGLYNGVNNEKYVLSFFDRFSEIFVNYVSFQKEGLF